MSPEVARRKIKGNPSRVDLDFILGFSAHFDGLLRSTGASATTPPPPSSPVAEFLRYLGALSGVVVSHMWCSVHRVLTRLLT